jgi:hypothetical protein
MPRIPDNEIERLKNEVSVERLVEASGVELKRAGKDWLGRCPFHDDAEASLVVTPQRGQQRPRRSSAESRISRRLAPARSRCWIACLTLATRRQIGSRTRESCEKRCALASRFAMHHRAIRLDSS